MSEHRAVAEDMQEMETPADGTYREGVHQWRRCFARMVDNMFNLSFVFLLVMLPLTFLSPDAVTAIFAWMESASPLVDPMLTMFVGAAVNALLLGLTGGTTGKWIFGIRVREADGAQLGLARAIRREFRVWMRGLGFGVPVVSLVTAFCAYKQMDNFRQTTWDRDMQLVVTYRPAGVGQYMLWTVATSAWVALLLYPLFPA